MPSTLSERRYALWRCSPEGIVAEHGGDPLGCGWSSAVALHPRGPVVTKTGDRMRCPHCHLLLQAVVTVPSDHPEDHRG